MDQVKLLRSNVTSDVKASFVCAACRTTRGIYRIKCKNLVVDGVALEGYWIDVNDIQIQILPLENSMHIDYYKHIVPYSAELLKTGDAHKDSQLYYESMGDRILISGDKSLWGLAKDFDKLQHSSERLLLSSESPISIVPYRDDFIGDDWQQTMLYGEYFNPYLTVGDDPSHMKITNGEETINVNFETSILVSELSITGDGRITMPAIEFDGMKTGEIEINGISNSDFMAAGNVDLYYMSTNADYRVGYQHTQLLSREGMVMNITYADGSISGANIHGGIQDYKLDLNGQYPFCNFTNWLFSNIFIAPLTLLTIITASISVTNYLDGKMNEIKEDKFEFVPFDKRVGNVTRDRRTGSE